MTSGSITVTTRAEALLAARLGFKVGATGVKATLVCGREFESVRRDGGGCVFASALPVVALRWDAKGAPVGRYNENGERFDARPLGPWTLEMVKS